MTRVGLTLNIYSYSSIYKESNHYTKLRGSTSFSAPANQILEFNIEVFPYNDNC